MTKLAKTRGAISSEPRELLEMLTYARPHESDMEQAFVNRYVVPVAPDYDGYGNHSVRIGDAPVLWSCHTDTVDRRPGRKQVQVWDGTVYLVGGKAGMCLGADDGAGVWIMREMIRAKVPGLYIFHRGEERGGLGSGWIVDHNRSMLDGIEAAIALDRKGTQSIITHQMGMRCCSAKFAEQVKAELNLGYVTDDTGVFTDTANYAPYVSECTNLSIGYEREHGPTETLDLQHVVMLRDAMTRFNPGCLGAYRDPMSGWDDLDDFEYPGQVRDRVANVRRKMDGLQTIYTSDLYDLVTRYPEIAAELLCQCGIDEDDFEQLRDEWRL